MAEIKALVNFLQYFADFSGGHNQSSTQYNFDITHLAAKLLELKTNEDNILLFYLHHSDDDFSSCFCDFLLEPNVAAAFRNDNLILYCWDLDDDNLKPELMQSFATHLNNVYAPYIQQNKSAVFEIGLVNKAPNIFRVYEKVADLTRLRNLLNQKLLEKEEITPFFYQELMSSYLGDSDYHSFERTEHEYLKKSIGYALYGPPTEVKEQHYGKRQQMEINKLYLTILQQNDTFCKWNGRVVISFVWVCAETLPEHKKKRAKMFAKKKEPYHPSSDFIPYPAFVLRKCKHKDPAKACRIIIDREGRVYQSWKNYLETNHLPACNMIYPVDGLYCNNNNADVKFATKLSPSYYWNKKMNFGADATTIVAGLGIGLSLFTDKATSLIGFIVSVALLLAIVMRIYNIINGRKNKQIFGFDSEKRIKATGIRNNMYRAHQAKNTSPLLMAQISTSILFFANSVCNLKAITDVIETNQAEALSEIEISLSNNRRRHTFNMLLKESIQEQGPVPEKVSVISTIRNMENVDEVMATLSSSNKVFNSQGIQFNVQNSQLYLNGIPIDIMNFGNTNKTYQRSFLQNFSSIHKKLTPNAGFTATPDGTVWPRNNIEMVELLIEETFNCFEKFVRNSIIEILILFLNRLPPAVVRIFTYRISGATDKLIMWTVGELMEHGVFKKILKHKHLSPAETNGVLQDLEEEFLCQYIGYEFDNIKKEERKELRKNDNKTKVKTDCNICFGYYYV